MDELWKIWYFLIFLGLVLLRLNSSKEDLFFSLNIQKTKGKYTNQKDNEKLILLDEVNNYAMSIEKKYENA